MPRLMAIWAIDAPPKAVGEVSNRKRISHVHLHLKVRLAAVGGERSLADNEPHNVADIELSHPRILSACSTLEQSHVALICWRERADQTSHVAHNAEEPAISGSSA